MIKERFKYQSRVLCFKVKRRLGIHEKLSKKRSIIFCLHGVVEKNEKNYNSRFISTEYFKKIVAFLASEPTINVVSLTDYLTGKLDSSKLSVVLTFDDGYSNVKELALPILEKEQMPATLCVNNPSDLPLWNDKLDILSLHCSEEKIELNGTHYVLHQKDLIKSFVSSGGSAAEQSFQEATSALWQSISTKDAIIPFWKRLSTHDLIELSKNHLVEIIPHGEKHLPLIHLNEADLTTEIQNSIHYVKETLHTNVSSYCLAYGAYNNHALNLLRNKGIQHILSVDKNSDHLPNRLVIHPHLDIELLKYFIYH